MMNAPWPPVFLAAREAVDPIFKAAGYRFAGADQWGDQGEGASGEYRGHGRRVRLVYEGSEGAIWLDTAAEHDTQIVSRWVDIEWILAGARLDPNHDLSEDRLEALVVAAAKFVVSNDLPPRPPDTLPDPG